MRKGSVGVDALIAVKVYLVWPRLYDHTFLKCYKEYVPFLKLLKS